MRSAYLCGGDPTNNVEAHGSNEKLLTLTLQAKTAYTLMYYYFYWGE
jgi:hypothetical protein